MKVLFLGGGTGGHLAPGIGIAEVLRRAAHDALFLVAGRDVEHSMLEPRGFAWQALFGHGGRPALHRVAHWLRATHRWRRALIDFGPDVVVVLGGWVALPAVLTGFDGRPSVLVEPNARPGKVQRLLSRRVDHVCLAVEGARMPRGRVSTQVTGTPMPERPPRERRAAAALFDLDPERQTLLLMGGSQGAADLNALLPAARRVLGAAPGRWQILHISGLGKSGRTEGRREDASVSVVRVPFVSDMAAAWTLADVAVCRAGAGTIAELAATGTPAVLVPYPHHADRHQESNGRRLVEAGGAVMVGRGDPQGVQTASHLLAQVLQRLPAMTAAARRVARPEAARTVADIVCRAAAGRPGSRADLQSAAGVRS